ncbi:MAG: hypothetical protein EOP48_18950, partial [Sphingobacteriales bacterium]
MNIREVLFTQFTYLFTFKQPMLQGICLHLLRLQNQLQNKNLQGRFMKYKQLFTVLFMILFFAICKGQSKPNLSYSGPKAITRNLIQDKKGQIWIAAFDGVFRYDGTSITDFKNPQANKPIT